MNDAAHGQAREPLTMRSTSRCQADGMHALLVRRADELDGCTEASSEEAKDIALVSTIEAYETMRWCGGKIPGGKG